MSLYLTIVSPEEQLWSGKVAKVTIPTQSGEITVLPGHQSLISVVQSGMMKLTPEDMPENQADYVIVDGKIVISIARGLLLVHEDDIIVTTSVGTNSPKETTEVLEKMQKDMEERINRIKMEGNEDELEEALIHMEKITSDLRMAKIKNVR